jgi:hypothetical protein
MEGQSVQWPKDKTLLHKKTNQIFYNFFHININQYKYDQHFFFFNFTNLHCMNDSLWFCWAFTICPGSWCRRFPTIADSKSPTKPEAVVHAMKVCKIEEEKMLIIFVLIYIYMKEIIKNLMATFFFISVFFFKIKVDFI